MKPGKLLAAATVTALFVSAGAAADSAATTLKAAAGVRAGATYPLPRADAQPDDLTRCCMFGCHIRR